MVICNRDQFLFYHLRKTGGRSVTKMLRDNYPCELIFKHVPLRNTPIMVQNKVKKYYSFTFVRNPITRLLSWYKHLVYVSNHLWKNSRNEQNCITFLSMVKNFEGMVHALEDQPEDWLKELYFQDTQLYKLTLTDKTLPFDSFDFIGKQERFEEDWKEISKIIKADNIEILHRNVHTNTNDSLLDYYSSKELVERVYNHYYEDFEYFQYEIPEELKKAYGF